MVCLGLEPGTAGWKAQTNSLSYGGTPRLPFFINVALTVGPNYLISFSELAPKGLERKLSLADGLFLSV